LCQEVTKLQVSHVTSRLAVVGHCCGTHEARVDRGHDCVSNSRVKIGSADGTFEMTGSVVVKYRRGIM
jgi:hypothetical protein